MPLSQDSSLIECRRSRGVRTLPVVIVLDFALAIPPDRVFRYLRLGPRLLVTEIVIFQTQRCDDQDGGLQDQRAS